MFYLFYFIVVEFAGLHNKLMTISYKAKGSYTPC